MPAFRKLIPFRVQPKLAWTAALTFLTFASVSQAQTQIPYQSQIDPHMLQVLETYQPISGTPLIQLAPVDARQQFAAEDAAKILARSTGAQISPMPVGSILDTNIPTIGGDSIPIRIYTPTGSGPFPVVLYFHGGGFVIATIDTYDASARALANGAGAIVISVEYRKAPEHPFPAALEDALASYYWTINNATNIKGIPNKIAVAGESAGGNLAAELAILTKTLNVQQPVRQVLIYPVVDGSLTTQSEIQYANAIPLSTPALVYFFKQYLPAGIDPENPLVSPLQANLTGVAPATVISSEIDPLQTQGAQYVAKLTAAGVKVDYKLYPGTTHEFFGMGAVVPLAAQAEAQAAADLKASF